MNKVIIFTFLTTLIVINYVLGACVITPNEEYTLAYVCRSGDITDLRYVSQRVMSLNISKMIIPVIEKDIFSRFGNGLVAFECSFCDVENISFDAFKKFTNLRRISLPKNRLRTLSASWLQEIEHLEHLDLNLNQIEYIEDEAFKHLRTLQDLNLRQNKIKGLKFDLIKRMEILNSLDLSENPDFNSLREIFKFFGDHKKLNMYWSIGDERCFAKKDNDGYRLEYSCKIGNLLDLTADPGKVKRLSVFGMPIANIEYSLTGFDSNLSFLVCSFCEIRDIQPNEFIRFPNLEYLGLQGNRLKIISPSPFKILKKLQVLDLNFNEINTISDEVYSYLKKVKSLHLSGNQLKCLNVKAMSTSMTSLTLLNLQGNGIKDFNCISDVLTFMDSLGGKLIV